MTETVFDLGDPLPAVVDPAPAVTAAVTDPEPPKDDAPINIVEDHKPVFEVKTAEAVIAETEAKLEATAAVQGTTEVVRSDDHDAFVKQLIESRSAPLPEPPPPMTPTPRQMSQIELEMEAGRKRVQYFKEQDARRPVPLRDPSEGTSTPVFRPPEYQHEADVTKGSAVGK